MVFPIIGAVMGVASVLGVIDFAVWGLTGKDVVEHVTGVDLLDKGMELVGIDPGVDTFEEAGGMIGMVTGNSDNSVLTAISDLGDSISAAFVDLGIYLDEAFSGVYDSLNIINENVLIVMAICAVILIVVLCVFLISASTHRNVRRLRR